MKKFTLNMSLAVLLTSGIAVAAGAPPVIESASAAQAATNASVNGPQDAKEAEAFADKVFAEKMKKFNVNGSNFVVVKDGKVVVSKGYGFADKEKGKRVDKNTIFQIASVSKTFTALAVMQLVDQGKIDLHKDVQQYLGGIKIPNKTGKPLTTYDLLTYTTGFDRPDNGTYVLPEYVNKDMPLKEFVAEHMPTVVRTPGEAYTYDNFGFILAGYVVESVSGMPFDQYMDKHVFKPLGMNSTGFHLNSEVLAKLAVTYGPDGKPHLPSGNNPTASGSGGIISTGEDMAKYLMMQLQNGKFGDQHIVSKKSMDLMHTFQIMASKTIPQTTVGFEGYFNDSANGQQVVLKGGNAPGHSSLVVLLPEKNTAMYMSYNNDSMMNQEVYEEFMDHYYPNTEKMKETKYMSLHAKQAEKYEGLYQNTRFFALRTKFSYADGNLVMKTGTTGQHTLRMINPLLFEDELGSEVAFKKDHIGNIKYFYYTNPKALDFVSDAQKLEVKPFSDVPADSKYKTHIDNVHAFGVIGAKSDNLFNPKGTMTQQEFADALFLANGWHIIPMIEGIKKNMMSGIPGVDPVAPITRQMAAVMIQNLKHVPPASDVKVIGETDAWAVDAIIALVSQGVFDPDTKVNPDGSVDFRSKQPLLRQEASALLDKSFGYHTLPFQEQ